MRRHCRTAMPMPSTPAPIETKTTMFAVAASAWPPPWIRAITIEPAADSPKTVLAICHGARKASRNTMQNWVISGATAHGHGAAGVGADSHSRPHTASTEVTPAAVGQRRASGSAPTCNTVRLNAAASGTP
jgi:hypothetical protein